MTERQAPRSDGYQELPAADITVDQVVAWNMHHWRQARYMTQEELGRRIGWSAANVSAAERSVERERRRFDAQTIAEIADALYIPVAALFLPPEDDGHGKRYRWHMSAEGSPSRSMADLMQITMHDNDDKSDTMEEYRDRFRGAVTSYLEETWGREVAGWFAPLDDAEARAEQAARFRSRQAVFLRMADEEAELAAALERPQEETQS